MAAPSGSTILNLGTEIVLEASGAAISNGAVSQADDDNLLLADVDGAEFAVFEIDLAATPFTGTPTAGAFITILERKINSDSASAPTPTTTYLFDQIGGFSIKPDNAAAQKLTTVCRVNFSGGDYFLYWKDGGAGTVGISSGWALRATPIYSNSKA
jgi:hypothetical protein